MFTNHRDYNLALIITSDGQNFLSLSEPGTEYSNSSERNLQQQEGTGNSYNNLRTVRAIWKKYKNIQFKKTTKVKKVIILLDNNLATNKNNNEISQQISQRNNGEKIKKNRRMEEISVTLRDSYQANAKELKRSDLEDFEKHVALKHAREKNLWFEDILLFGTPTNAGGNEHTIVYNENENALYKSNNLYNSKFLISHYLEKIRLHNIFFPETRYEIVGFTGIDKGSDKVPYIEPIAKQNFIPNAKQATEEQIDDYMKSLGFTHVISDSYRIGNIAVHDLKPRNVLVDSDGDIYVIDAEFINAEFESTNKIRYS